MINSNACDVQVKSAAPAAASEGGEVLSYTGYVDRGARIEARFSKRPVKVSDT